jgi:FMN phosphatase YigB (HAD superfamily)
MRRAVVFDLWGTPVPFPAVHHRHLADELADALGVAAGQFRPAWAATFAARATGTPTRAALTTACASWPRFEWRPDFDAAVFSSQEGATKPAPALYRKVLRLLGVEASEMLCVGDRSEELRGALAVGMEPLLRIRSLKEVLDE